MKIFLVTILIFACGLANAQTVDTTEKDNPILAGVIDYQKTLNKEYADSESSPLDSIDLVRFSSLNFFSPSREYIVSATFEKRKKVKKFKMKTSTDRKPAYTIYGDVYFVLKGGSYRLTVYQNVELSKKAGFERYLFLPFTDLTNGETTYGGGRYIDLKIPDGNILEIDFNKAYNPYCAYAHRYSCPIPPPENFLNLKVEAGVKEGLIYK